MQDDSTALITASSNGHHKLVELLLDRGADIEASDRVGADLSEGCVCPVCVPCVCALCMCS